MNDYRSLMLSLWQSACQDTPKRPSATVQNGRFVLTITGNRGAWTDICKAAGVPDCAEQTVSGDTLTARWPSVADQIFGADGLIAARLPRYEVRAAQLHMARLEGSWRLERYQYSSLRRTKSSMIFSIRANSKSTRSTK